MAWDFFEFDLSVSRFTYLEVALTNARCGSLLGYPHSKVRGAFRTVHLCPRVESFKNHFLCVLVLNPAENCDRQQAKG
jgi:hypothetical protein